MWFGFIRMSRWSRPVNWKVFVLYPVVTNGQWLTSIWWPRAQTLMTWVIPVSFYYDDFEWNGWSKSETGILRSILIMKGESDHATSCSTWHGEELAFPWLSPRGVNGLSADRSKRYVCSEVFWSAFIQCWCSLAKKYYLPYVCLKLRGTTKDKGCPVKLVCKCMYVRVITRMINSLPMTWLVQWRNSITMVYVYEEYQKNCCILGRYFGQFACNRKVFRPTNIVCNFISWWQLKFYS